MESDPLPLRDLHLPEPVSWWPLAPGWWILIAVALVVIAWLLLRQLRLWRRNAPRRFALRELAGFEADYLQHRNPVVLAKQVSELLRRTMLAYTPRKRIAGLTGEQWLGWLDEGLPVPYFHTEGGKSLLTLPYRDPSSEVADADINALLAAVKMRLSTPHGEAG